VLAANKSVLARLDVPETTGQENYFDPQLPVQPVVQPPRAVALPFEGNLKPHALMPVVVQLRLLNAAAYSAPHAGDERVIPNSVHPQLLRGRGGM